MLIAGWSAPEDIPASIDAWLREEDGRQLGDGVEAFRADLGRITSDGSIRIGAWGGGTSRPDATDPLVPLRTYMELAAPSTDLDVSVRGRRTGHEQVTDLLVMSRPGVVVRSWRPARSRNSSLAVLPAPPLLLVMATGPETLVPDWSSARDVILVPNVSPADSSFIAEIALRNLEHESPEAPEPTWMDDRMVRAHGGDGLLKVLHDRIRAGGPLLTTVAPDGEPVVAVEGSGRRTTATITTWAGETEEGELAAVALVLSSMVAAGPVPPGVAVADIWGSSVGDPAHLPTVTGQDVDRLETVGHSVGQWEGTSVPRRFTDEDGESWTEETKLHVRQVGTVHFPSRSVSLCDPRTPRGFDRATLDLRLQHPGPYPVFAAGIEVDGHNEGFGALLVRLADGAPSRWVEAPAVETGRQSAAPGVDTGACAIGDTDAVDRLAADHEVPLPARWFLDSHGPPARLLSTQGEDQPDLAILTDIGGDVPTSASLGLDDDGRPVALVLDTWGVSVW